MALNNNPFDDFEYSSDIKDKQLDDTYKSKVIEDVTTDQNPSGQTVRTKIHVQKNKWLICIILIGLGVLVFRNFYLQMIQGDDLRQIAEENRIRIQTIKAARGIIYDKNENPLVKNVPNFYLYLVPADLPTERNERTELLENLALVTNNQTIELTSILDETSRYSYQSVTVMEHIDYEQALLLMIQTANMPGVNIGTTATREYLADPSFSHLIGYIGKINTQELETYAEENYQINDYIGKSGLELYYEKILKGTDGKKQIEVDSLGKEQRIIANLEAGTGNNLVLTIDGDLQVMLKQALQKRIGPDLGGAAIAIDPRNGEVLALVSLPDYDNNLFTQGISVEKYEKLTSDPAQPLFPRATAGQYPPGSSFKPIVAAAALQEEIISSSQTIDSTGGIQINQWFFPDWKTGGHGQTDVYKALAESVNTYFYTIGGGTEEFTGLGVDRINTYAELFGFNRAPDIDLPHVANGFLPTKTWKEEVKGEPWYIGDTYHLAIGQGDILVTPLHIAQATATVANHGTFYKPHLVKKVTDLQGNTVYEIKAQTIRKDFIDPSNIQAVREGLRQAVTYGSAKSLNELNIPVAGKTGTAQYGSEDKTHAWFTCFAPYQNPEIVITVIIEGGGEGYEVALPVAKEFLQDFF